MASHSARSQPKGIASTVEAWVPHTHQLASCHSGVMAQVYNELGGAFKASPSQLGDLALARALVQALSSPLGGIAGKLGDLHRHDCPAHDFVQFPPSTRHALCGHQYPPACRVNGWQDVGCSPTLDCHCHKLIHIVHAVSA